jgi:short-chain Z-isoprenyl diphosphate synthase
MTTQERPLSSVIPQGKPRRWPAIRERARELVLWPFYWVYQRRLEAAVSTWKLPRHVGIIMDGNRRYARRLGFQNVNQGHLSGAQKLWEVLGWCYEMGVPLVTVWSFSLENFERDIGEVGSLLQLFEEKTNELAQHEEVHAKQVRVRYLGQIERLPEGLQAAIRAAEEITADYERFQLNIAMAYGGRQEIAEAFRRYLRDKAAGGASLGQVIEQFEDRSIEPYLYTSGQPEPDLILRTSGEIRLGGFLLWQSAYSEFYFCETNWPALRKIDLLRALRSYHERHRRLGK